MADNMSQKEIDAFINSLTGGNTVEPVEEVKKETRYDFNRPIKFNKEQTSSLRNIYEKYSRLFSNFFTAYLRTTVQVDVMTAEQQTYQEFMNLIANPVILAITEMAPLKGSVIMQMSAELGYAIIDRIMGGPGLIMKKLREYTEIEEILLRRIVDKALEFIPQAWENIGKFTPKIDRIVTNAQFANLYPQNEMTALVALNVKIGPVEGMMNFCIPYIVIEPSIDKLNTLTMYSNANKADEEDEKKYNDEIEAKLEKTSVEVSAVIGRTRVTVDEFVGLQVGDCIPLDSFVDSDIRIMVGNLHKFDAKPGVARGRNAVQITRLVDKEE